MGRTPADWDLYERLVSNLLESPRSTAAEIAAGLGVPVSSAHSYMLAIEACGRALFYVEKSGRFMVYSVFREYVDAGVICDEW